MAENLEPLNTNNEGFEDFSKPEYSIRSIDGLDSTPASSWYDKVARYVKQFTGTGKWGRKFSSRDLLLPKGGFFITKDFTFYRYWRLFIVGASLYSSIFTPLEFGFYRGLPRGLWLSDLYVQGIFMAAILVKFFTAYRDPVTYRLVASHRSIAMRYIKSDFLIEVLACLPWDTIYKGLGHHEAVRYFVWIRLYRLRKVESFCVRLEKDLRINYFAARIMKLLAVELFFTHTAACFYYYLATTVRSSDESYTWIGSLTLGNYAYTDFRQIDLGKRYVTSLYWAVLTMTTVGYGDIHAVNIREMIFVMIYVSFDMILGAYLVGNMSALIVKGSTTEKFRDKMTALTKFMNRNRLPHNIRKKMKNHVTLQFESGIMAADEAVENLPISIRSAVAQSLYGHIVSQVPLFRGCSSEFMNEMISKVIEEHFLPGEVIIHQGGPSDEFYIVCEGALEELLIHEDGKIEMIEVLQAHSVFGEVGVLCHIPQPFTVRVTELCRVLRMAQTSFNDIVQIYFNDGRLVINNLLESTDADAPVGQIAADVTFLVAKQAEELALMVNNAAYQGDLAQLKHLVKQGAIVAKPDYDGRTPLHLAAAKGLDTVALYLIREGADVNAIDHFGISPLLESVKGGHSHCTSVLMGQGAQLHLSEPGGYLCQVVKEGNEELLRDLLSANADVNSSDYDKRTALHIAAAEGSSGLVQLLLDSGAEGSALDRWGRTALDEAQHHSHEPLVPLLRDAAHNRGPEEAAADRKRPQSIEYASSPGTPSRDMLDRQNSSGRLVERPDFSARQYRMLPMRPVGGRPPLSEPSSAARTRRRVTIFPYHPWTSSKKRTAGKVEWVPPTVADILDLSSQYFGEKGVMVLNQDGGEISSTDFIMDGDKIYVTRDNDIPKA